MTTHDKKPRLLIVDDTPENIAVLMGALKDRYAILTARDGQAALRLAREKRPDLILLDIVMPDMDGYEVCDRLKAEQDSRDIPVIFISGLGQTTDKVKAFTSGGVDYVTKPFQREEVLARVETHLALRRQREQIQESLDQLRHLEHLRDNLVHMIVHDMRSPLMGMLGFAEILHHDLEEAGLDRFSRDAQEIRQSGYVLRDMITNMLDISRLEADQLPLQYAAHDLRDIAGQALQGLKGMLRGQTVEWSPPEEACPVFCDETIVRRVIENLLANAIKFTGEEDAIRLTVRSDADEAEVLVSDTGPGIPLQFRERIFDKFAQVEARQEGKRHSSGLGLTFCKLAVESHGGSIHLESEEGKGSTFRVVLPRTAAS